MGFIRDNLLKIFIFLILLIIIIFVFSLVFGKKNIIADNSTYSSMEDNLLTSAKKYARDNSKLIPKTEEESNKITLDTLEKFNYITTLNAIDDSNVKCTGYVELLYKNKKVIYVPYLKCGKYYETKTLADQILSQENIVTSDKGLYKYGDRYIFRGENINNYVLIGKRIYRIIELNENGEIRLVSTKTIVKYFNWDNRYNVEKKYSYGINDYSKSRLKDYFNDYLNESRNATEESNGLLSQQELEKIIPHDICIGKRYKNNTAIDDSNECQTVLPNQYISLITISDYARASIDPNCRSIYDNSCINYNYFYNISSTFRTITAVADNSFEVFIINYGKADITKASHSFRPNIVVYIDKLSLYNSGDGSIEKPYTIR